MYTVIMRDNGVDRTYKCDNKWDAIVLFDALTSVHSVRVEMWDGMKLDQFYQPI